MDLLLQDIPYITAERKPYDGNPIGAKDDLGSWRGRGGGVDINSFSQLICPNSHVPEIKIPFSRWKKRRQLPDSFSPYSGLSTNDGVHE